MVSTVSSAFTSWNIPAVEQEWKDEELLKLNGHPGLNRIHLKLYVFLRPGTGQKTITTDYGYGPFGCYRGLDSALLKSRLSRRDILPLFGNPHTTHIPLRRVKTLAQALVFIMAKGDTQRLRSLGLAWTER